MIERVLLLILLGSFVDAGLPTWRPGRTRLLSRAFALYKSDYELMAKAGVDLDDVENAILSGEMPWSKPHRLVKQLSSSAPFAFPFDSESMGLGLGLSLNFSSRTGDDTGDGDGTGTSRIRMPPEAFMTTPELVKEAGYPIEVHKVVTDDRYILEVHRIPSPGSKKPPVYLQHGILCSSSDWVIAGPGKGLGYLLHDLGYDVWMGNFRGNRYSRRHMDLDPDKKQKKFWDFSFHEAGVYDIPAVIDHVLNQTGQQDLLYVAHSMGSSAFFVMLSERPAYNVKVRAMCALAPVSRMGQVRSPLLRLAAYLRAPLMAAASLVGQQYEMFPNNQLFTVAVQWLCQEQAVTQSICANTMFLLTGFNHQQLNKTLFPVLLAHMPAGTSAKALTHYAQLIRSKCFQKYSYGMFGNLWRYGSLWPPPYDLSNVRVPVSLHYSDNDWVSGPDDVHHLHQALPNAIGSYRVKEPDFNHVDFLWGMDVKPLVYDTVIGILETQSVAA